MTAHDKLRNLIKPQSRIAAVSPLTGSNPNFGPPAVNAYMGPIAALIWALEIGG